MAVLFSYTEFGIYYRRSTLDFVSPVVIPSTLSTSYEQGCGFTNGDLGVTYGKKSEDGKTISWYNTEDAESQLNNSFNGRRYYFLAIG